MSDGNRKLLQQAGELANNGRYSEAGQTILAALGVAPDQVGTLNSKLQKLAYLAATYFVKADDLSRAIELYLALGEKNRAADCLEKNGDMLTARKVREGRLGQAASLAKRGAGAVGGAAVARFTAERYEKEGRLDLAIKAYLQVRAYDDAARLLRQTGRIEDAANVYAEGGRAFEAGFCFLEIGDVGKALDNLVRVSRQHPRYRQAALEVVALGVKLKQMSFQMDNFLSEFIRTAPQDNTELDALYQLGELYEAQDFLGNAKEVLEKVAAANPGYRDVQSKLARLKRFSGSSAAVYEKIRAQEASFRGEQRRIDPKAYLKPEPNEPLPDLPPLPELPDLSDLPPLEKANDSSQTSSNEAGFSGTIAAVRAMAPQKTSRHAEPSAPQYAANEGFEVGNVIANRYALLQEIGRGGMAVVFKAEDKELDEEIALKVFLTQINDPAAIAESEARFKQELKLSRKLIHKNIIRLYDIGIHSGHRYISMELLDGRDLDRRLSALNAPMDFVKGIYLTIQACAGLNAAHEQGVVHRDIKPENLFVTRDGVLKVMDFGIAKNTVKPGMTMEGTFAGTPHYIAPEQISSFSKVTAAADLYSLGVVMYKMFTAKLPFDNEDLSRLLMMQITNPAPPPSEINPNIPKDLEMIILKLMAKNPGQRFKDARETAAHLKQVYLSLTGR